MRQDKTTRDGLRGELSSVSRREVFAHRHRLGERTLGQQQIASRGPCSKRVADAGVAGVHETPLPVFDGICYALHRMWYRLRGQGHHLAQSHDFVSHDLSHGEGISRGQHPGAVDAGHALHQSTRTGRSIHRHGRGPCRTLPPAPAHEEHGKVGDVIGVEVGDRYVGNGRPVYAERGHPVDGAAAAIEQQAHRVGATAAFHEVGRAHTRRMRRRRSRANGGQFHVAQRRRRMLSDRGTGCAERSARRRHC